ncbi:MAG: type III pantothenate kinase [Marinoscillum sp.]|uniref:type III pantothenate kinase n=1 Tax=Marinoscillum sp. TaxID=2024838 RepID=UPI003300818A
MKNEGNVVVDIGNSKIKTAIFEGERLVARYTANQLEEVFQQYDKPGYRWIFSSVGEDPTVHSQISALPDHLILTQDTPLPIVLDYHTPETLGVDRIAASVGAFHLYKKDCLVIDAGTCITYDLVDKTGVYRGGAIAPGLRMRMKAMAHFTRRLPDVSTEWEEIPIRTQGKTTRECLVTGAFDGVVHEMDGFIEAFLKEYKDLAVILTGGDANYFESKLKAPIFADFDLVLTGLNTILNYNK